MTNPAQFWRSRDAEPLCSSCAWSSITLPRTFDDTRGGDLCGAGCNTRGLTATVCFSYEGTAAELVTIDFAPEPPDTAWQDRVDGMMVRRPK